MAILMYRCIIYFKIMNFHSFEIDNTHILINRIHLFYSDMTIMNSRSENIKFIFSDRLSYKLEN